MVELPSDAPLGVDIREYLKLDDCSIELNVTPNRGDCFSVLGIAREVAAGQGEGPLDAAVTGIKAGTARVFPVRLDDGAACPRFARRVVSGLSVTARTPDWLRERLRRAGLRTIHPVVDVTNYVMLEYGQPLHAYRLDRLKGSIGVRSALVCAPARAGAMRPASVAATNVRLRMDASRKGDNLGVAWLSRKAT